MEQPYFIINSVVRTVEILEYLATVREASVAEVGGYLGENKSTAHRFLASLKYCGILEQNAENKKYRLSFKLFEIGNTVVSRLNISDIVTPIIQELSERFSETVNLAVTDNKEIIYIGKSLSRKNFRMDCPIGGRDPLYCTALGKAILAHKSVDEINQYIEQTELIPRTENTIIYKNALRAELQKIKSTGYAVDNQELLLGLMCFAVPIFDINNSVLAAISISIPIARSDDTIKDLLIEALLHASRDISNQLGAKL